MYAVISPEEIQLPAGSVVRLPGTWQEYRSLCDRRGDGSIPRIKYRYGEVLLMSPLPKHGRDAHLIAAIIATLLDYRKREYDAFTPVTMQLPEESGIEPDYCFYIDHWQFRVKNGLTGATTHLQIWYWKSMSQTIQMRGTISPIECRKSGYFANKNY